MILRYVKGLPAEQVAAILGRSLDCVRAQLNFGVNALRRALSDSRRARGRTSRKPSEEGA
jgi:DNA-directed RNA polymerase specialized sigma24 family protein